MKILPNLNAAIKYGWEQVLHVGKLYEVKNWQGVKAPAPMIEALWLSWRAPMPQMLPEAKNLIKPNLPWADEHFKERVGTYPVNPPPSHEIWPFNQGKNQEFIKDEKFDHTYPERFWPKYAGRDLAMRTDTTPREFGLIQNKGIRFNLGDLNDLIGKLNIDLGTRQAYLPIWFPEDTGKPEGVRVPCSLGYHFLVRNGYLHITYFMRSLDMLRHYQDDIYLCYRLALYVKSRLKEKGHKLYLGYMVFNSINSHIFSVDEDALLYKLKTWKIIE